MIRIIAIYWPNLVVHQAQLHEMCSASISIQGHRVMHNGSYILRGFAGADIRLDNV